jgi:hypothetical protein
MPKIDYQNDSLLPSADPKATSPETAANADPPPLSSL